ncbi:MAG: nodulation protein NfeD [Rubripirellula sp.]|nr:nodulation protein NfeD [Rubripirellula sp.]
MIDVPTPLDTTSAVQLVKKLSTLNQAVPEDERTTTVLRYQTDSPRGDQTGFEDALKLARAITSPNLRRLRIVSFVEGEISGHSVLPIIASDALITTSQTIIGDASAAESITDPTIVLTYESIAERRGLFPKPIVAAFIDPGLELAEITRVGGEQEFVTGKTLEQLRKTGDVLRENVWSQAGIPLKLDAKELRSARISAGIVNSAEEAAEVLDLADLKQLDQLATMGEAQGVLLEISGSIADGRVKRWQSNLNATLKSDTINTWLIAIDSTGGNLDGSMTLAGSFANPEPPLQTVAGMISVEARGDSALIALACKPLFMKSDATLGGPGSDAINQNTLMRYDELIDQIAASTNRPTSLIRGLLDPTMKVFQYTNRKTGRIRYATENDLTLDADDPAFEKAKWIRGERVQLEEGLTSQTAISLGLVDGEATSIEDAALKVGLPKTPPLVSDRGLIRFVENLGRSNSVAFMLLFIGFIALSAEASAPGLSVPGFIALTCFALFFWMKFLAGTAEWLELIAFTLGLICIAIEIFVLPGVGIFGIGGVLLTLMGIVLMSQTFVFPENSFQLQILNRGIWTALASVLGLIGGVVAIRFMLPHVPLMRGLMMEPANQAYITEAEKLADFSNLLGQTGVSSTPLRPAGKVKIGNDLVQVVSTGSVVAAGQPVRVTEVNGTRVVVEPIEEV